MRKFALLPLLVLLASCGAEPEPVPLWQDPDWKRIDSECERFPDWTDGLSLEELLACVERRGAVLVAGEVMTRAALRKEAMRTFPSFPFEVAGVRPSRNDDKTTSGAMVRHVFDNDGRWEKRQLAMTAEIALARKNADDLLCRVQDVARCAYWSAVAAERRLEIVRRASGDAGDEMRFAEQDAADAREEVAALAGGEPPPSWTLSDSFPIDLPEVDLDRAVAVARDHRTRLAALAAAAAEARCRLEQVEAAAHYDPGIGVSYSIERDRNTPGFDFHDSESSAFVGFSVTLPVRSNGRRVIAGATAETRATLQARSEAEAEIVPVVTEAVIRYREARARVTPVEETLPPTGPLADRIRAREDALSGKPTAIDAQLECAIARSRLEAAVGRPVAEYSR